MAEGKSAEDEIWVNKFDEESASKFRTQIIKQAKQDPSRPIIVYIDSFGGYVDSLAKMIETMDEIPNPIVTVCAGKAMSCGAILLSHGDIRYCGQHSRVMVHEVSAGATGDVHDIHADTAESKRLNRHFIGLLAKNCGIKGGYDGIRKIFKDRDGRNIWMDAKTSVEFGIVDKVGLPNLGGMIVYEISDVPKKDMTLVGHERAKYIVNDKPTKKRKTTRKKRATKKKVSRKKKK